MHIVGFGSTQWSSLNRIVRTVFLEIEIQMIFGDPTHGRTDDREMRHYSMIYFYLQHSFIRVFFTDIIMDFVQNNITCMFLFIIFCMHIFIVQCIDLDFRIMRYIKSDIIIILTFWIAMSVFD